MQEEASSKLNYLGQYFVALVPMQRPAKNRAISSAPSIRHLDD
jgi:hypothetical protein